MKKIVFILLAICLIGTSCERYEPVGNGDIEDSNTITSLQGTAWKLSGIVNTQTNVLEKLEPKNCEDCYTLTFITETTAEVFIEEYGGFRQKSVLDLSLLGEYAIEDIMRPKEGDKFIRLLYSYNTKSYSITSDELKFINDIDNYYLLFKRIEL